MSPRGAQQAVGNNPQFLTEIDDLDVDFLIVRSKHENALPLIVTHGCPGSDRCGRFCESTQEMRHA